MFFFRIQKIQTDYDRLKQENETLKEQVGFYFLIFSTKRRIELFQTVITNKTSAVEVIEPWTAASLRGQ